MQLFKRILLSIFPDETINQGINPASMFISFISTKEFFSVINRKIVENYKLNLFDITTDPFEFKIGFGENIQIKQKDIDTYYSYCATANMNGYRFFNSANIGNSVSMVASLYTKDIFNKYSQEYFLNFLYTVYLLFFIFSAKIKIFPFTNKQENYNRFIEIFFNFYEFIFQQTGKSLPKEILESIKKDLLNNTELFFFLFYSYQKFNILFSDKLQPGKEFYTRLFADEVKKEQNNRIEEFADNSLLYTSRTNFNTIENKLLQYILPADILMRYLFLDTDMFMVTETIISKIFDKNTLDIYLQSFLKDDTKREECILYITDYKHFKKNFFQGVQKYIITALKKENSNEFDEESEEMISRIGDNFDEENTENIKIPERIKKESKIMEKILNFYITFVGGFRIARGENLFIRLCRKPILDTLTNKFYTNEASEKTLYFYGGMLYNYGKNIFYYKYISENVRLGRQRFYLPYKSTNKNTYSNIQILNLFDESCISTIFQDINPKDIRIYSKNKQLLTTFKKLFSKRISEIVQKKNNTFIASIYNNLQGLLANKDIISTLQKNLTTQDIYHIKENLYNIDFWISNEWYEQLNTNKNILFKEYDENAIIGICAELKETFLGYLLYDLQLQKEEYNQKKIQTEEITNIYIEDILHIQRTNEEVKLRTTIIQQIKEKFHPLVEHIITLDDNEDFLRMGTESRKYFLENNGEREKTLTGEDIIRFKGYLKNITYYNKRFLIPK